MYFALSDLTESSLGSKADTGDIATKASADAPQIATARALPDLRIEDIWRVFIEQSVHQEYGPVSIN